MLFQLVSVCFEEQGSDVFFLKKKVLVIVSHRKDTLFSFLL